MAILKLTLKLVLKLMRPWKIRNICIESHADSDSHQRKGFREDPQYKSPGNLREGTNNFVGRIYRDVHEQWLTRDFDDKVIKVLADISRDAVPSNKRRTVWRGLRDVDPKSELAMAQEGSILAEFPPTSTSVNRAVAVKYGRKGDDVEMLMKIIVPKGTPIVLYNAEEMEVLLKQNFRLRIDRIDLDVPLYENHKKPKIVHKVIQATVLPSNK